MCGWLDAYGFYTSSKGFEKYGQSSYCYLIKFCGDGSVLKGVPHEGCFHEVGSGRYTVNDSIVTCMIKSNADGFESKWVGRIESDYIHFEIEKPDFEDIEGKYTYIESWNR